MLTVGALAGHGEASCRMRKRGTQSRAGSCPAGLDVLGLLGLSLRGRMRWRKLSREDRS